jgi:diguanylate cyclase
MNYSENRQQSAEWAKAALACMGQNDAAFHPVSYTVWYEHVSGTNPPLSRAIDHFKQTEPRLSNATIDRLYREYIAGVDQNTMDRISRDFQQVMSGVVDAVQRTGDRAGALGEQLSGLNTALESQQPEALRAQLQQAAEHSRGMQRSAVDLQAQVDASRQEIERLRADLDRAREEVFIDSLTKVLNRKGLEHHLDRIQRQVRNAGGSHGLVMLDIDHFKRVNDTHGHQVGDQVLAAVGEVLRQSVRSAEEHVARYGGEEFAILMPNASLQQAAELAERVRHRAKAMKLRKRNCQDVVVQVTVSAGAAELQPGEAIEDWIARADAALYRSKQGGRDRVSLAA